LFFLIFIISTWVSGSAQHSYADGTSHHVSPLFNDTNPLKIRLSYSKKNLLTHTNDSTYIKSSFSYQSEEGPFKTVEMSVRARGDYRRLNCYYLPLWFKISKDDSRGTLFEEDKKLKLVLPCLKSGKSNDHVIKELIAYKIYEVVSPYHFETKMVYMTLNEDKNNKLLSHDLIGFFIQNDKKIASLNKGSVIKRQIHPKVQDPINATRNDFFQFMIGNTDYSLAYQHNEKLFIINKKLIPVPYDFDMSGIVNVSYAVVSRIQNQSLPISTVTIRLYRGFDREEKVMQAVRQEYLSNESKIYDIVDRYESYFQDPKEFKEARNYLKGFFKILKDDKKFSNTILKKTRTKLN